MQATQTGRATAFFNTILLVNASVTDGDRLHSHVKIYEVTIEMLDHTRTTRAYDYSDHLYLMRRRGHAARGRTSARTVATIATSISLMSSRAERG